MESEREVRSALSKRSYRTAGVSIHRIHRGHSADLRPCHYCWLFLANIRRALTVVPDEARSFYDLVRHQYLPGPAMRDFGREYRAITHAQIELLAGRISAINRCVY